MRGGCLLAVGARRARGSNKFSFSSSTSVRAACSVRPLKCGCYWHAYISRGPKGPLYGEPSAFGVGRSLRHCSISRICSAVNRLSK